MKKFRASGTSVEAIEIISETAKTVTYDAGVYSGLDRERKFAPGHAWFDTWDEAKAWLLKRAQQRVAQRQNDLDAVQNELATIERLTQETP